MMIQRSEISYDEFPYGVGFIPTVREVFRIQNTSVRALPYVGDQLYFHTAATFEHSTSVKKIKRVDYGILQWAADVGGLYNLLSKLFLFLLSFLVGGGAHLFVGTHLMTQTSSKAKNKRFGRHSTILHQDTERVQEHCCLIVRMKLASSKLCRPCFRPDEQIM